MNRAALLSGLLPLLFACRSPTPTSDQHATTARPLRATRTVLYYGLPLAGQVQNVQSIAPASVGASDLKTDGVHWFEATTSVRGESVRVRALHAYPYTGPNSDAALMRDYWTTQASAVDEADGVIFVIDSQRERMDANAWALDNLQVAIDARKTGRAPPVVVVQYNKRDLSNADTRDSIAKLVVTGNWPVVEAVADQGRGVHETLEQVMVALDHD